MGDATLHAPRGMVSGACESLIQRGQLMRETKFECWSHCSLSLSCGVRRDRGWNLKDR
jgi:hypothetical protein